MQSTLQQKHDRDMKEQQQAHLRIVKDYETRLHELDANNRVIEFLLHILRIFCEIKKFCFRL